MSKPFITVIIQAYKRKKFIENAIKSVLNQTLDKQKYEILVIKAFRDKKIDTLIKKYNIKSIYNPSKKEGVRLVSALNKIRGQVIAFLDDDDEFEVDKLKFVYKYFKENPNLSFYHNSYSIINENNKNVKKNVCNFSSNYSTLLIKDNKNNLNEIIQRWHIQENASSMAVKKKLIREKINELKKIRVSLDAFLLLIALLNKVEILADKKALTRYRIHGSGQVTHGKLDTFDEFCLSEAELTKKAHEETKILYKIAKGTQLEIIYKINLIETKIYYNLFNTKRKNYPITVNDYILFLNSKHYSKSSISLVLQTIISRAFKVIILKLIYMHAIKRRK